MRTWVLFSWDKKTNFSLLIRKCPPLDVVVVEWTHIFALVKIYQSCMHISYKMTTFYKCIYPTIRKCASDPTDGFTRVSLAAQNLKLQIPYDKSPADRYSKVDGVERFWVYTNDKPFKQGSPTRPRTETRISVCIDLFPSSLHLGWFYWN